VFERHASQSLRGLAFFFGLLFIIEVGLVLGFGVDYRYVETRYAERSLDVGMVGLPLRLLVPFLVSLALLGSVQLFLQRSFVGRAIKAVSQDELALRLVAISPSRIKRIAFALSIATASVTGALLIVIQPVEPSIGRDYIGGCSRSACSAAWAACRARCWRRCCSASSRTLPQHSTARPGRRRWGSGCCCWRSACGPPACAAVGMGAARFHLGLFLAGAAIFALALAIGNDYVFFAGYVVVQYVVLATAWNILGGYVGYVNFGSPRSSPSAPTGRWQCRSWRRSRSRSR